MRNRNRWLAAVLTLSLALGNCGGITALATGNIVNSENSLSENTIISDEAPEDDVEETENSGDFSETSAGHTDSEDQMPYPRQKKQLRKRNYLPYISDRFPKMARFPPQMTIPSPMISPSLSRQRKL